jgi:hypothetical protein
MIEQNGRSMKTPPFDCTAVLSTVQSNGGAMMNACEAASGC